MASVNFAHEVPLITKMNTDLDSFRKVASLLPFEQQHPDTLKDVLQNEGFSLVKDNVDKFGIRTIQLKKYTENLEMELSLAVSPEGIDAYGFYFNAPNSDTLLNRLMEEWQSLGGAKPKFNEASLITQNKLSEEMEEIHQLLRLAPFEKQDTASLKQKLIHLGYQISRDVKDSFGLVQTTFRKGDHYVRIELTLTSFDDSLAHYKLQITSNSIGGSLLYHSQIIHALDRAISLAWQQTTGEKNGDSDEVLEHEEFEDVLNAYSRKIISGSGTLSAVQVPQNLVVHYATLVSDGKAYSTTSEGFALDTSGNRVSINELNTSNAMHELIVNDRIDLVENVLDGYNPMGRIHAIRELEELGLAASPINKPKIARIFILNEAISFCGKQLTSKQYYKLLTKDHMELAGRCPPN